MGFPPEVLEKYVRWLRMSAAAIGSDGCTLVSELYKDCCLEHDLGYHYGKDPRAAFLLGWDTAPTLSRKQIDQRFRDCIQANSPLKKWSPVSWIRYAGVRLLGGFAWSPKE